MRIFLTAAFLAAFSCPAFAQPLHLPCAPKQTVIERLNEQFDERQVGSGTIDGNALAVFVSESNSFTIIIFTGNGFGCVLAGGEDWETWDLPPKKPETRTN